MEERDTSDPQGDSPFSDPPVRRRGTAPQQPPQQTWGQPQPQPGYGPPPGYYAPPPAKKKTSWPAWLGLGCLGVVVLVVAIVVTAALASGGKSGVNTTPAAGSPGHSAAPGVSAAAKPATVGQTIDLSGLTSGDSLAITLVQVVNPATSSNEFLQPDAGDVYVAVQFKIVNTGSGAYSDDPDIDAVLIDSKGQQYQTTIATITQGPGLNSSLDLAPGGTTLGFEVFQVPNGTVPAQVQYQLNAGFTGKSAQWNLN